MYKRKFEMTVVADDDGISINGENHGFTALEIVGFLEAKKQDILNQLYCPEKFKLTRTTEVDGEQIAIEEVEEDEKESVPNDVTCKECEYLDLEGPYATCSKAYEGMVKPYYCCGKGKRK